MAFHCVYWYTRLCVCVSVSFFELEGWNSECRLYLGIEKNLVPGIFEKSRFFGREPKMKMAILKFLNGLVTSFFGLQPWKSESTSLWPKPRLGFFGFWKKSFLPKKTAKMAIFEPKFHSWPQFSGYNLKNWNQHHFGHYRKTVFFVFGKSHFYQKKTAKIAIFELINGLMTTLSGQ